MHSWLLIEWYSTVTVFRNSCLPIFILSFFFLVSDYKLELIVIKSSIENGFFASIAITWIHWSYSVHLSANILEFITKMPLSISFDYALDLIILAQGIQYKYNLLLVFFSLSVGWPYNFIIYAVI